MSTKKSHRERQAVDKLNDLPAPQSLIHVLENTILAIESSGCDEATIFGLVNCIMMGWIRNGVFSDEYMELVRQTIDNRAAAQQSGTSISSGLVGADGQVLGK